MVIEKWILLERDSKRLREEVYAKWMEQFHISFPTAKLLYNRGLRDEASVSLFLKGSLSDLHSPWLLKDMEKGVRLMLDHIKAGTKIRVIGDYDVDGVTSATILKKGLQAAGAKVDADIPHRIKDGYGLNARLVKKAHADSAGLIITCDNGIAALEEVALAKALGMDVIVTDHHEVPFVLEGCGEAAIKRETPPAADAVIDPKQQADTYPFRGICGAAVAYKFVQALFEEILKEEPQKAPAFAILLEECLELTALATVCDVMELLDENRILVKEGLGLLRQSKNKGLKALMEASALDLEKISVRSLGFVLGPCLNAAGRLESAMDAFALLNCEEEETAKVLATRLHALNESRKEMTEKGVLAAEAYLAQQGAVQDAVFVIYLPGVHESLAGLIAGRLREKYNHPVFVMTDAKEGVKGSGRSIPAYHMFDALTAVKDLLTKFGGHAQAAGLSLACVEDVEKLRCALNEKAALKEEDFVATVALDMRLPLPLATLQLAEELSCMEPCGTGAPRPLFGEQNVTFCKIRTLGTAGKVAVLTVRTAQGEFFELKYFRDLAFLETYLDTFFGPGSFAKLNLGKGDFSLTIAYYPEKNFYKGRTSLQLILESFTVPYDYAKKVLEQQK